MNNEELNERLSELKEEICPVQLEGSGKAVARPITFAYCDGSGGGDEPSWVGFCENNITTSSAFADHVCNGTSASGTYAALPSDARELTDRERVLVSFLERQRGSGR